MRLVIHVLGVLWCCDACSATAGVGASHSKRLLIDPRVVDTVSSAEIAMGAVQKHSAPLLMEDRPWEFTFLNMFPSIWYDTQVSKYRLWYWAAVECNGTICPKDPTARRPAGTGMCNEPNSVPKGMPSGSFRPFSAAILYAESVDGITFTKPSLNLTTINGSKDNNVVLAGPKYVLDGFSVLLDEQDADPSRRWKMVSFTNAGHGAKPPFSGVGPKILLAVSADGFRWTNWTATIHDGRWDTYPSSLWDQHRKQYVIFDRLQPGPPKEYRTEAYLHSTSADFLGKWSNTSWTGLNSSATRQPDQVVVFEYEGIWLGFGQMMNLPRGEANSVDLELALATELQGKWTWLAPGQHLIPRGAHGSRDSCEIFGARQPFVKADEIWIYYVGGDGPFHGYRTNQLMLAKIQRDGFAGYRASASSGVVVTKNVTVTGPILLISADTRAGSVSVGVIGDGSVTISVPITGKQVVDEPVHFEGGADLSRLLGVSVRLNITVTGGAMAFGFAFST